MALGGFLCGKIPFTKRGGEQIREELKGLALEGDNKCGVNAYHKGINGSNKRNALIIWGIRGGKSNDEITIP